jgi:hypothetical protein
MMPRHCFTFCDDHSYVLLVLSLTVAQPHPLLTSNHVCNVRDFVTLGGNREELGLYQPFQLAPRPLRAANINMAAYAPDAT